MSIIPCEKILIFDKITDSIYLGDIVGASNYNCVKDIDIIISLVKDTYHTFNHIKYFIFPLEDNRNNRIDKLFT